MRALLDTNVFLWWNIEPEKLSEVARELLTAEGNDLTISAVSAWEVVIKHGKGHLSLPEEPATYVSKRIHLDRLQQLPVGITHALHVSTLPAIHRDPFDRLLVAQAQMEGLPILTSDPNIARYDVDVIW